MDTLGNIYQMVYINRSLKKYYEWWTIYCTFIQTHHMFNTIIYVNPLKYHNICYFHSLFKVQKIKVFLHTPGINSTQEKTIIYIYIETQPS